MPERFFNHAYFEDGRLLSQGPLGLTTLEIAEAAMREIVQLELSASPFDVFMTDLLDPYTSSFRWVAQLGQIRETRTALSGLFGRFVARAYLTRYHGFQHFEPIRGDLSAMGAWPGLVLERTGAGDLPDWVVSPAEGQGDVAVAEAKGSHNASGPKAALDRAYEQARRVGVMAAGVELEIKRYAIATRWAVAGDPKLQTAHLWVDDPKEGEREATPKERLALQRSIGLGHFAALARGMGYGITARQLSGAKSKEPGQLELDASDLVLVDGEWGARLMMIAVVTRSGIVRMPQGGAEDFQAGLASVFGDEALIMAVDVETLKSIDQMAFGTAHEARFRDSVPDDGFWSQPRAQADGVELLPLNAVAIKGRGVGVDLIGPQET